MKKGDSSSLVSSSFALLSRQYSVTAFNIVFSLALYRLLSKEEFAVVVVFDILAALCIFTDFGLNTVFIKKAPAGLAGASDRFEALGLIKLAVLVRIIGLCGLGFVIFF